MSSDIAIKVENISKCYQIYQQPRDRLKQFLLPRLRNAVALQPKHYYREFWALKDVSFTVHKGETVGIIGRNGSGKSTLLQMVCGTLNPTSGNIATNGRIAALLELGSGFNPEFTGRENVYMNAAVLGLSKDETDTRFDEIVAFADIGDFIEQPVKTYSSGMMVRLAFAVAICVDPDILIVDEALSVGDELFQRKCFSRIESIRANGATILFVSHSGAQIIELCDRAMLLDSGENIFVGLPKEAVAHYQKLLYVPRDKRNAFRAEILSKTSRALSVVGTEDSPSGDSSSQSLSSDGVEEYHDPSLVPSSSIDYESHGPLIDIPYILSLDGRKVNHLLRGRTYRYCYHVVFKRAASAVRFGMSIKTTTGLSLAGAMSAPDLKSAISTIAEGEVADIEFSFDCNFNPGVYFMNAGVFGEVCGEEVVLHRRAEIIAFRVLPVPGNIETEIMSLSFKPSVRIRA